MKFRKNNTQREIKSSKKSEIHKFGKLTFWRFRAEPPAREARVGLGVGRSPPPPLPPPSKSLALNRHTKQQQQQKGT